jgi:hypothetical protein
MMMWVCQSSCTNCVFRILQEVGAERKASVEDPRTLVHDESGDY